jgi:hypothetical protein
MLTAGEKSTLEKVHDFFAPKSWKEVKDTCHALFKEWEDPGDSQNPIEFEKMILLSGRRTPAFVEELVALQREKQFLTEIFA